jgi:glycine hydroxymethyltransferase
LTTRGFGAAEFDRVAELVVEVLANTEPAAGPQGLSKAKYVLADGTAERVHAAASELLADHQLYPGLTL